jgi:signal recognition particle subunit SEC65
MVYVDDYAGPYGTMKMSHMIADTETELHEMAQKIGLKREWFQPRSFPHYDVCKTKRTMALKAGAKSLNIRQLAYKIREIRSQEKDNLQ